ncbi:MAG: CsgG/HfaB family protein [Nitrospirota bacterium]
MYKRIFFFVFFIVFIFSSSNIGAQTSFAMFSMEKRGDVTIEKMEEVQVALNQRLIESKKYLIVDRQRVNTILREQAFQHTGATDQNTVIKLGKILNVEKFIHMILYKKAENQLALRCSVIDVATGQAELVKELSRPNYPPTYLGNDCAGEIISSYPLIGKIEGSAKDIMIVNLGSNQGIKNGDRLFAARKKVVTGDDGMLLFQELVRIGILEVISANEAWSKTKVMQLTDNPSRIMKDDIVSPTPIPKNEPQIFNTPLLKNIKKGDMLLEDDMKKHKYLSVLYNEGDSYHWGKLQLTSRQQTPNPARCFYPPPFDQLQNIVLEGKMEFNKKIEKGQNCFKVFFRFTKQGTQFRGYSLLFNIKGQYAVSIQETGKEDYIIPFTSTPYLNRGESENTFEIIAYDSKFDIYINDKYLASFADETCNQGTVGLVARPGTSATVSKITIWKAEKE